MLTKHEYLGCTVNFRSSSVNFKTKKRKKNDKDDWQIFPDSHEAIITQETWDLAQKLSQTKRRIDTTGEANPLTGLLFCADCGAKIYNHRGKNTDDNYTCSANQLGLQSYKQKCSGHYIGTASVRNIILDILQRTSGYVREHEDEFIKIVREKSAVRQGETAKSHKKQITKNERRTAELEKIFRGLYEDKILGRLLLERFDEMSAGYEQEQADLKTQTAELQSQLETWNVDGERADKFIELVRRHTRFENLTNSMINEFIDKILVHESVWSEKNDIDNRKGSRTQKVEVYLKYIADFDVPDNRTAGEIEAERIALEKAERIRTQKREYSRKYFAKKRAEKESAEMPEALIDTAPINPKPAA